MDNDAPPETKAFLSAMIATISTNIRVDRVIVLRDGRVQAWTQAFGQPQIFSAPGPNQSEAIGAIEQQVRVFVDERNRSTPRQVAEWMRDELTRRGELPQDDAANGIVKTFGKAHTYYNANGNRAIGKDVLAEFRKLTDGTAVWERGYRAWRLKRTGDGPNRSVE